MLVFPVHHGGAVLILLKTIRDNALRRPSGKLVQVLMVLSGLNKLLCVVEYLGILIFS